MMEEQHLNRRWTHQGKVYDTAASEVMGTKKGYFANCEDDGSGILCSGLRTATPTAFLLKLLS